MFIFFFFQNIVLWCTHRKILRQFKFFSKLSCEEINYVLLKSVKNLFLVNKFVNRSLKKMATKYSEANITNCYRPGM